MRREGTGGREQVGRGRGGEGEGKGKGGEGRGGEGRERERTSRDGWRLGLKEGKRREEDDEKTEYLYIGNFLTQIFPCDKLCFIIFIPTPKHVLRVTCPCFFWCVFCDSFLCSIYLLLLSGSLSYILNSVL